MQSPLVNPWLLAVERQRAEVERLKKLAESPPEQVGPPLSFREFILKYYPRFRWYPHCDQLVAVLQRVADGELKRLMIFMPPRHGKTQTATKLFPAYFLYKHPEKFVSINSYAAELANSMSRAVREFFKAAGGENKPDADTITHWETIHGGGLFAAGVGGPITGKGWHCFPGGTKVLTQLGKIDIEALCGLTVRPKVLSYNHETQSLEWKRILATARQPGKSLVEITLSDGSRIRCTSDHPVFSVKHGYRAAGDLLPGETVIQVTKLQKLSDVRSSNLASCALSELLSNGQNSELSGSVRSLWSAFQAVAARSREVHIDGMCRSVLFSQMQPRTSRYKKSSSLQGLSKSDGNSTQQLLQFMPPVPVRSMAEVARDCLWPLQCDLPPNIPPKRLLLKGLPELCSFSTNEGERKQPLQNRYQLCGLVSQDAPSNFGAGWQPLRSLWCDKPENNYPKALERWESANTIFSSNPSHRPQSVQQQSGESDHTLLKVPQVPPQINRCWEAVTVSSITPISDIPEFVYDLQIEGNHNFFADGLLVHNCGIIDDPLKNWEDAQSKAIREKQKDWFDSTFATREEPWSETDPTSPIVLIQTRWHPDDLSGWLLKKELDADDPERWHIVNMPAIREDFGPKFPGSCTIEPDPRAAGDALCPDRRPVEKLNKIRDKNPSVFMALYQQRPTPAGGGIIKLSWFNRYGEPPHQFSRVIQSWDTAATAKDTSAYWAGITAGEYRGNWYLLDVHRKRMIYPEGKRAVKSLAQKFNPHEILIENKSTGQSLIPDLRNDIDFCWPIIPIEPEADKVTRMETQAPKVEGGMLFLPESAPWLLDFQAEIEQFPLGTMDQIDAFSQLLKRIHSKEQSSWVQLYSVR